MGDSGTESDSASPDESSSGSWSEAVPEEGEPLFTGMNDVHSNGESGSHSSGSSHQDDFVFASGNVSDNISQAHPAGNGYGGGSYGYNNVHAPISEPPANKLDEILPEKSNNSHSDVTVGHCDDDSIDEEYNDKEIFVTTHKSFNEPSEKNEECDDVRDDEEQLRRAQREERALLP